MYLLSVKSIKAVKLHSLKIKAPADKGPKTVINFYQHKDLKKSLSKMTVYVIIKNGMSDSQMYHLFE